MPPKVSKVSSKPTQTKTIAKASTSSSSKSSGSSKSSSTTSSKSTVSRPTTSTVRSAPPKPAPVTSKPKNVDKVDFGKIKTTVDAGVYHRPKPIAAATGRDPEPPKPKKTEKTPNQPPQDLKYNGKYSETFKKEAVPLRSFAEQQHNRKIESEARKQIEAEKKVEAHKNKINAGPEMLFAAAALATAAAPPVATAFGADAIALKWHDADRQDKKEFTLAEKVAYDDYLYPKHHGYMSYDDAKRKEFAKENQEDIDKVKAEIKKEEEDQGS